MLRGIEDSPQAVAAPRDTYKDTFLMLLLSSMGIARKWHWRRERRNSLSAPTAVQPCKNPLRENDKPKDVRELLWGTSGHLLTSTVSQCHAGGAAGIAEVFHPKPGLHTGAGNLTSALPCPSWMSATCQILYSLCPKNHVKPHYAAQFYKSKIAPSCQSAAPVGLTVRNFSSSQNAVSGLVSFA